MTSIDIQIVAIALLVSVTCAVPGVFLVLRRLSLMSDAISHAILLGIVLAYFVVGDLASPFLIAGAAATGLLTVFLVELVHNSGLVKEDAAIALVFPALFSLGVLLIGLYQGNVHLDVDAVLLGELAFAPFHRFEVGGMDLGPISLWVMSGILILNIGVVSLLYKEFEISTFDAGLASSMGFAPVALHYAHMALVSVTAVGAFEAVGSILVVALMIVPACTAYLLTDSLRRMLWLTPMFAAVGSLIGYGVARTVDGSLAGAMATAQGVLFLLAFLLAPERGIVAQILDFRRKQQDFGIAMLTIHILQHEGTESESRECSILHLDEHLGWELQWATKLAYLAQDRMLVHLRKGQLSLTDRGRELAQSALVDLPDFANYR
jgi:manganese/zinc/iron transport system permease protein